MADGLQMNSATSPQAGRKIPRRIAQAVISSLKGGVVPRVGLPYITVGRTSEIEALLRDVEITGEGGRHVSLEEEKLPEFRGGKHLKKER